MSMEQKIDKILEGNLEWVRDIKHGIRAIDGRVNALEKDVEVLKDKPSRPRKGSFRIRWDELIGIIVELPMLAKVLIPSLVGIAGLLGIAIKYMGGGN